MKERIKLRRNLIKLSFTDKHVTDSLMSGCPLTDRYHSNQSLFFLHSLILSVLPCHALSIIHSYEASHNKLRKLPQLLLKGRVLWLNLIYKCSKSDKTMQ